jgi:hypothetical protein
VTNTKTTKKASHLQVVDNNKDEQIRAMDYHELRAEREKYTLTDAQLDAVLGELIETADRYFIESAFNFRNSLNTMAGSWGDHPYLEDFVDKLDPYCKHLERKLHTALPGHYHKGPGEPDSDLTSVISRREEYAYIIGVFIGAKLAGASNEKLNALRRNLVL